MAELSNDSEKNCRVEQEGGLEEITLVETKTAEENEDQLECTDQEKDTDAVEEEGAVIFPEESESQKLIPHQESDGTVSESEKMDAKEGGGGSKISLKKELTLLNGVGFVIGQIIGSGIFITPPIILAHTSSVTLSLALWVVGGLISLCGGLCYCELGTFVKKSGGEYTYILKAYSFKDRKPSLKFLGSLLAFLYIWTSTFFVRPAGFALITLASGKYIASAFYLDQEVPVYAMKTIALSEMLILAVINCYSVKWSVQLMTVLSATKVCSCAFIVVLGAWKLLTHRCFPMDACLGDQVTMHTTKSASDVALALYAILMAYDGWNVLNYSVEEQVNVEKNLPRAMWIGLPIVALSYILVSIAFFAAVSSEEMLNGTVALKFGEALLGRPGAFIISILVALSAFGAANGSLFAGVRVIHTSARDGQLPEVFSGIHTSFNTPVPATLLVMPLSAILLVIGNIEDLIDGSSAAIWMFYGLTIVGLLIMRITHKMEERPFKVSIILPIFMVVVIVFLTVLPIQQKPIPSALAFIATLLGIPAYMMFVMETPWRLRPQCLDDLSAKMTSWSKEWLNSQSSR